MPSTGPDQESQTKVICLKLRQSFPFFFVALANNTAIVKTVATHRRLIPHSGA
jgi:hypothetical protein